MRKKREKKVIFESFKILWNIMGHKEKIACVLVIIFTFLIPFINIFVSFIPSLIIARIIDENVKILGFIDLSFLSDVWYYCVVILLAPVLWVFGMLVYRFIDILARKIMCIANEKMQDLILMERKNLDFKMTTGEAYYIVKNAVDNIYNIIEPAIWYYISGMLSLLLTVVQLFIFDFFVGLISVGIIIIIFVCIILRTKYQNIVMDRIEVINGKIGNHFLMSITNLPMITMFSSKKKELAVLKGMNDKFFRENKKRANVCFWYWVIVLFVEYAGILGIILYLIFTHKPNLVTTITSTVTMLTYLMGTIQDWGFSLNDLQIASLKLCNIEKIYPENLIKELKNKKEIRNIKKIEIKDYFIKLGNFEKRYNCAFSQGKIYLLVGKSGAGKTTLINAICGLREIEEGNLIINGKYKVKNLYNYRDKVVYLFQDSILFDRSLKENIAYPDDNLNEKAEELIDKFNIKKIINRNVQTSIKNILSGGEKKRVDLIRTLSKDKDIYLFDEPTNELDGENVKIALEEIRNVVNKNKIVILISHDDRCFEIADEIIYL